MKTFHAADLIRKFTVDDIWALLEDPESEFKVVFDDGEYVLDAPKVIASWYYWELYRCFWVPGMQILKEGCVYGFYTSNEHRRIGSFLLWHVINENERLGQEIDIWDVSKAICEIGNEMYNVSCVQLAQYPTSCSLHDLMEILDEPSIVTAKTEYMRRGEECDFSENVMPGEIARVHGVVSTVLYTNHDYLRENGIKKLCIPGLVSKGQMLQLIGPRGYVHDVNGRVFPYPINVGYAEGFETTYDVAAETRSGARALMMTTAPLEESEYANRKVQLATAVILGFDPIVGGCDHYVTVPYLVEEDDLVLLKGKYYMENGTPVLIWDSIDHLVGRIIDLRSITGCGHHDVQKVCTTCLGWVHRIIPPRANLGYTLATPLCALISQLMLSTKHYEGSSVSKTIELDETSSRWFRKDHRRPDLLYLSKAASEGSILIRLDSAHVKSLSQIHHIDISELSPERLSRIPILGITRVDKEGNMLGAFDQLKLQVSGSGVHLSPAILEHLKKHSWNSGRNYIEFTLTNWGTNQPIFIVPRKGDNIMIFFNDVRSFLEASGTTNSKITDYRTRGAALSELINILRRRLNKSSGQEFNIVQAEILIRALMMKDVEEEDYRLPHTRDNFYFEDLKTVIFKRSLSAMLAFQTQHWHIMSPHWRDTRFTTRHPLDYIIEN